MPRRRSYSGQGTLFEWVDDQIVLTQIQQKRCTSCLELKPLDQFYRGIGRYGREPRCSRCDYERKQTPDYRSFERNRKATARASRPMMELRYAANRRLREFEEMKREFDYVP